MSDPLTRLRKMQRFGASFARTRFQGGGPFVLSHLLTACCNADCPTCLWRKPPGAGTGELSTLETLELYREAAAARFAAVVVWGGEPLLRPDAGMLLHHARNVGLATTLITNGWWLEERCRDILPWIDRLIVSVDAVGERHDRIRRCPGLFSRLEHGVERVQRQSRRPDLILICVVSRLNVADLRDVAEFGRRVGAKVVFQNMNRVDYGSVHPSIDVEQLALPPSMAREAGETIRQLRRQGYPVADSGAYISLFGIAAPSYRCHYKKVLLRVEPNGDILDCTRIGAPLVNVRTTRLRDFTRSALFRDFVRRAVSCNRCLDPGVIELSRLWEGRLPAAWAVLKTGI